MQKIRQESKPGGSLVIMAWERDLASRMKVTFISNYINHHQIPFSDEMYTKLGEGYRFIQTEPMEEERVRMGWAVELRNIPYLLLYYEQKEYCDSLIQESDIVIFGGTEREEIILPRLKAGKITIRNSERLYREGQWKAVSPRGLRRKYIDHTRYRRQNVYLLCCGGYVSSDFHIVHAYPGKMLKWGYFPKKREYPVDKLPNEQDTQCVRLLWAGRFLELKHPEYAILAAKRLKEKKIPFHLTMVGSGELEQRTRRMAEEENLGEDVTFTGFLRPEEVRRKMEQSHIFLFTSNRLEGWGAVLNEAMNSGLAVVADHAAGAVPFLLRHGGNGMVYRSRRTDEFLEYVERLACNHGLRRELGRSAYRTIVEEWNAENAASRLLDFCTKLLQGEVSFAQKGPCSQAEVLSLRKGYHFTR